MTEPRIRSEHTVEHTLTRFPAAALVFVRRGMACVGCAMAPVDTLFDAARAYGQEPEELVAELGSAVPARG